MKNNFYKHFLSLAIIASCFNCQQATKKTPTTSTVEVTSDSLTPSPTMDSIAIKEAETTIMETKPNPQEKFPFITYQMEDDHGPEEGSQEYLTGIARMLFSSYEFTNNTNQFTLVVCPSKEPNTYYCLFSEKGKKESHQITMELQNNKARFIAESKEELTAKTLLERLMIVALEEYGIDQSTLVINTKVSIKTIISDITSRYHLKEELKYFLELNKDTDGIKVLAKLNSNDSFETWTTILQKHLLGNPIGYVGFTNKKLWNIQFNDCTVHNFEGAEKFLWFDRKLARISCYSFNEEGDVDKKAPISPLKDKSIIIFDAPSLEANKTFVTTFSELKVDASGWGVFPSVYDQKDEKWLKVLEGWVYLDKEDRKFVSFYEGPQNEDAKKEHQDYYSNH